MIKVGIKGKIVKGTHSPNGELLVEDDTDGSTGGYYIYIWPNDGTKWPGTDKDMIYDIWSEDWSWVEGQFEYEGWEVEWADDENRK